MKAKVKVEAITEQALGAAMSENAGGVTLRLLVHAGAATARIGPIVGDRLKIAVHAPAVAGRANEAIIELIAATLGLRRKDVALMHGHHDKRKQLQLEALTMAQVIKRWPW